jgi:8-amino-7-oxononanoate synthase
LGFKISEDPTPIIPLLIGEAEKAVEFSRQLFKEGVFSQAIRPPTVPKGTSRLRLTLMASHTMEDLNFALEKIAKVAKKLAII